MAKENHHYSRVVMRIIQAAEHERVENFGSSNISIALFVYTVLSSKDWRQEKALKGIVDMGVNLDMLAMAVKSFIPQSETAQETLRIDLASDFETCLDQSSQFIKEHCPEGTFVEIEHIIYMILYHQYPVCAAFKEFNITPEKYLNILHTIGDSGQAPQKQTENTENTIDVPALNHFARNLYEEAIAGQLDPVIGREKEIEQLIVVLKRRRKNNPLLLGEPGVGKTAIIEGLQQRINAGEVPLELLDKQIFDLRTADLIAGTKWRGQFEERVKQLIQEVRSDSRIILFIDEFHSIIGMGTSSEDSADFGNFIKPALTRGDFRCIGATTSDEYRKYVEKDGALDRRFFCITVDEPSNKEVMAILASAAVHFEEFFSLTIDRQALLDVPRLSQHIPGRNNPDKSLDIVDLACAKKHCTITKTDAEFIGLKRNIELGDTTAMRKLISKRKSLISTANKALKQSIVTLPDLEEATAALADIDARFIRNTDVNTYVKGFRTFAESKIINQPEMIAALEDMLLLSQYNVNDTGPLGVIMLDGPEGVGKTELAYLFGEYVLGSRKKVFRLDMADFKHAISATSLKGVGPGYVGYDDQNNNVFEHIRRNHLAVVILDEIEEMGPDIQPIFIKAFEASSINDARGRAVSLDNVFFILTSNVSSKIMRSDSGRLGYGDTDPLPMRRKDAMKAIRKRFSRKFLDRVHLTIIANSLDTTDLLGVTHIKLKRMIAAWTHEGYNINIPDDVLNFVVQTAQAEDKKYHGARGIERSLRELVIKQLALYITRYPKVKSIQAYLKSDKIEVKRSNGSKQNIRRTANQSKKHNTNHGICPA